MGSPTTIVSAVDSEKAAQRKPRVSIFVESINGFGHFQIAKNLSKELKKQGTEVAVVSSTATSAYAKYHFEDAINVALPSLAGHGVFDAASNMLNVNYPRIDAIKQNRRYQKTFK